MSDQRIISAVTQHYKASKPTLEVRSELASSLREVNRLVRQATEAEKHLNLQTKFSLPQLVKYSMQVQPLPLDSSIYDNSWLAVQTRASNRKTADPKVQVVNRDPNDDSMNTEVVRSLGQIILNIQLEQGAHLLYTEDGTFPTSDKSGTVSRFMDPHQRTIQLTIGHKCMLRMVAQRHDKLVSNCISMELQPQFSNDQRRENYIMKHTLRMDESATVQSDPFFK